MSEIKNYYAASWEKIDEDTRAFIVEHTRRMAESLIQLTGRELYKNQPALTSEQLACKVYEAPFALVSHGIETDPILNYGNATALGLWEMSWTTLTHTFSRLTAEPNKREERARFLGQVKRQGFVDDYTGIRRSMLEKRFRIGPATVWNISNESENHIGQAAMFRDWRFL